MQLETKTAYIIRGIAGTGKSTLAKSLAGQYVASADNYPPLYEGGEYHPEYQSYSHKWCENRFTEMCKKGVKAVAVANTSTRVSYFLRYKEIAQEHGYHVQIINCEALYSSSGLRVNNVHGVPEEIIEHQIRDFQSYNQKPKPLSIKEALEAKEEIYSRKGLIVSDIVNTLCTAKPGYKYINKADQMLIWAERIRELCEIADTNGQDTIYLISNQCGVGNGSMRKEDLIEIYKKIYEYFRVFNKDIAIATAHNRNGDKFLFWEPIQSNRFRELTAHGRAAKPSAGMMRNVLDEAIPRDEPQKRIYYIGDSHTADRLDDIIFARNCSAKLQYFDIVYVPIEVLN